MDFFAELLPVGMKSEELAHLFLSFVLSVLTIVFLIVITILKSKRLTFNGKLLIFTISLTLSMWMLQYVSDSHNPDYIQTTLYERAALSFYHTLKAFGADDNFLVGINYIEKLLGDSVLKNGYRIYAVILGFIAPITSFTVFFEILANFFPKFRLWGLRYFPPKKKYYFSELNERSIALAKSILDTEKWKVSIIFTDVYANKVQESTTELLAEAKRVGAVCVRDDITHIQKRGFGERKYFLIDDNEIKNLQTLTNLTDKFNYKSLKKSEVYLFCQDYIYTDVEKEVCEVLQGKYKIRKWIIDKYYNFLKKLLEKHYITHDKEFSKTKKDQKRYKTIESHIDASHKNAIFKTRAITIIPVRCYRNLITNMLEKTPLYEPIVQQRKDSPNKELNLNVTILGIGDIGTEMFLTTYWIGQMLNCKLNINVISRESEAEFWGKIDYINPEIRRTTQERDELLKVYSKVTKDKQGNDITFADPYCKVKYYSCDIQSNEFCKLFEGGDGRNAILDTHYFLVSLGSDQSNLSIANTLKNRIGKYHTEHKEQDNKTIINYVVYNTDLGKTLNNNCFVCSHSNSPDIYMQAVGGVENVYCTDNIFMNNYMPGAKAAADSYNARQGKVIREQASKKRLKDEYEYWSNLALRLHFKYKVFSMGYFNPDKETSLSLFEAYNVVMDDNNSPVAPAKVLFSQEKYSNFISVACSQYKKDYRKKKATTPALYDKIICFLERRKKVIHICDKTYQPFNRSLNYLQHSVKNIESFNKTAKSFLMFVLNKKENDTDKNMNETITRPSTKENQLQWLEHRRWCAFIRTMGFRKPEKYKEYLDITQSHKQMDIKLHPCLVECDANGGQIELNEFGIVKKTLIDTDDDGNVTKINATDKDSLDLLDQLTYNLAELKMNDTKSKKYSNFKPYDFKQYDYPNNDYLDDIYIKKEQKK